MELQQLEQVLRNVLTELARGRISEYGRTGAVITRPSYDVHPRPYHYLVEQVPQSGWWPVRPRRPRLLVAVKLEDLNQFTVYQPHWLVPLQEELAAIESSLGGRAYTVNTNFVEAWLSRNRTSHKVTTGGLVAAAVEDLNAARAEYWRRKAALLQGDEPSIEQ